MANSTAAAGAYATAQRLLSGAGGGTPLAGVANAGAGARPDFGSLVANALQSTVGSAAKADTQTFAAAQGKADIVDVVTAVAESEAAIETLVAVRDRVIAAYEEIMRMPV